MAIRSIVSATNTQWYQSSGATVPVGSILAYLPGYFSATFNNGFTSSFAANVTAINSRIGAMGYRVCDGSAYSNSESPSDFFPSGVTRYLPNLTDERFLMGSVSFNSTRNGGNFNNLKTLYIGEIPGHSHRYDHYHTGTVDPNGSHFHSINTTADGGWNNGRVNEADRSAKTGTANTNSAGSHQHTFTTGISTTYGGGNDSYYTANSGGNGAFDVRPQYMHVFYIMKVF